MMDDPVDRRLEALLAAPSRPPDEAFTARVERLVLIEERLSRARRAAWRRFGLETAGAAAILVVFVVLARSGPAPDSAGTVPPLSAASAGLLLLALWVLVSSRSAEGPGAV
jgi:hypothetical protein